MCLVETKVSNSIVPFINCTPPSHQYFHKDRTDSCFGGGLAIIINKTKFSSIKESKIKLEVKTFEYIILDIIAEPKQKPISLLTVYRPPKSNHKLFFAEFHKLVDLIKNDRLIINGGFQHTC